MFRRSSLAIAVVASMLGIAGAPIARTAPKPEAPKTIKRPVGAPKRWRPNYRGDGSDAERMQAAQAKRDRKAGRA